MEYCNWRRKLASATYPEMTGLGFQWAASPEESAALLSLPSQYYERQHHKTVAYDAEKKFVPNPYPRPPSAAQKYV
jgi:hypothetical protein